MDDDLKDLAALEAATLAYSTGWNTALLLAARIARGKGAFATSQAILARQRAAAKETGQ